MASQTLTKFSAVFTTEPVRVEYKEIAKDGAFSDSDIKSLKAEGLDAIFLKPLTSHQRADLEASVAGLEGNKGRNMSNLYARFVAPCWCEEDGTLLGSAKEIGAMRSDLIATLFKKVSELNGMGTDAVEEAGKD